MWDSPGVDGEAPGRHVDSPLRGWLQGSWQLTFTAHRGGIPEQDKGEVPGSGCSRCVLRVWNRGLLGHSKGHVIFDAWIPLAGSFPVKLGLCQGSYRPRTWQLLVRNVMFRPAYAITFGLRVCKAHQAAHLSHSLPPIPPSHPHPRSRPSLSGLACGLFFVRTEK